MWGVCGNDGGRRALPQPISCTLMLPRAYCYVLTLVSLYASRELAWGGLTNGTTDILALEKRKFLFFPLSLLFPQDLVTVTTPLTEQMAGRDVQCNVQSQHKPAHTLESINLPVINCSRKQLRRQSAEGVEIETHAGTVAHPQRGQCRTVLPFAQLKKRELCAITESVSHAHNLKAAERVVRLSTNTGRYASTLPCQVSTSARMFTCN